MSKESKPESVTSELSKFGHEDLEGFARFVGVPYEELLEVQSKNLEAQKEFLQKNIND